MKFDSKAPLSPASIAANRESFELIAELFKAFSDATRLQLIQALRNGPQNVGELVSSLGLTQANVSKHLQVLFDAKLLSREKRGTATYYSIEDEVIHPLCELICSKINRDFQKQGSREFHAPDFSI